MLRTLFSGVIVVLLCVIAFLLYNNYIRTESASTRKDLLAGPTPPLFPAAELPPPPAQVNPANSPSPTLPEIPALPAGEVVSLERFPVPAPETIVEVVAPPVKATDSPETGHRTHVVRPGDSLWTISRKYFGDNDRSAEIARVNNIKQVHKIRVGQVLILPSGLEMKSSVVVLNEPTVAPESASSQLLHTETFRETEVSDHEDIPVEVQPPTLSVTKKKIDER